ncbi:N-formylglutamate deformylase [Archangium lansingense]|uniref:N-formylglutamate deformylase n=1 Tax=Archangium lansingense TaxID=2995310 RepID=A0ABT4A2P5_9BACT|nr:N-formylglutamate deformylase [Archangium lansinium]MCY1075917.1 N-formylglutamate deformylase [Archangium lansinium]
MEPYLFKPGRIPLLVSMPHVGTQLPEGLHERLTDEAQSLPDTDWHLPILYDFLEEVGASVLVARYSRYTIDLNRPPDDTPLYTTATTGLFPETLFDGRPLYRTGPALEPAARKARLEAYWRPYHERLEQTLAGFHAQHGIAVLLDAHSICSVVPRLFEGRLPDLNIGTADGRSVAPEISERLVATCAMSNYSHVLNGRFKGGYITRHYGRPASGYHAVQLEMAQCNYMDEEAPFTFREERAAALRPTLRRFVEVLADFARSGGRS